MKTLNLKELNRITGSWWIPFYREKFTDADFNRCGILPVHQVFGNDIFFKKVDGRYKDIGREKAEIITFLYKDGQDFLNDAR